MTRRVSSGDRAPSALPFCLGCCLDMNCCTSNIRNSSYHFMLLYIHSESYTCTLLPLQINIHAYMNTPCTSCRFWNFKLAPCVFSDCIVSWTFTNVPLPEASRDHQQQGREMCVYDRLLSSGPFSFSFSFLHAQKGADENCELSNRLFLKVTRRRRLKDAWYDWEVVSVSAFVFCFFFFQREQRSSRIIA